MRYLLITLAFVACGAAKKPQPKKATVETPAPKKCAPGGGSCEPNPDY